MAGQKSTKARKRPLAPGRIADSADNELFTTSAIQSKRRKSTHHDVELPYEQQPRLKVGAEVNRLPVRTDQGWQVQESLASHHSTSSENEASEPDSESVNDDEQQGHSSISEQEEILLAKEELAKLAGHLNEDPEENVAALRTMSGMSHSNNNVVKQLALITLCAIFKDLIPGYRIRPIAATDMTEKVSKEVKKLRAYEQSLVSSYKLYTQQLEKLSREHRLKRKGSILATTALSCAATLLLAAPHFNFRSDLLNIVVDAASRAGSDHGLAIRTLERLFTEDDDGRASLEAVQMLSKTMKARKYLIAEDMLNVFLKLRLLSEFGRKASHQRVDQNEEDQVNLPRKVQRIQAKQRFQTKRSRKLSKERKALEKEMEEADAVVSHEQRDKIQAEMLKLVFVCYFRILKAQNQQLMGAVLEGLARYAHLINQDFFADILEALRELLSVSQVDPSFDVSATPMAHDDIARDTPRESLLCIVTAFALLQGQEGKAITSNLHLDLGFFITHLYRTIFPISLDADIEWSSKSLHLADPAEKGTDQRSTSNVNVKTKTVLLIRCLSSVLLPGRALRAVPLSRLAAFSKQLMTMALQLPEKSCQAVLGLIAQTTKIHSKQVGGLWRTDERRGDGKFDPLRGELEGSNPFASSIWEGELLRLHYSPRVKEALKSVELHVRQVN